MISVVAVEEAFPVRKLAPVLEKAFKTKVSFPRGTVRISHSAYSLGRKQWDAEAVIEELEKKVPGKGMVLGVFPHDMYVGSMNFVFGAAQLGGRAAVLSTFRLKPPAAKRKSEKRAVESLFLGRVEKEALHEVGHLFGLHHCRSERCVMSFSPTLYWVEFKPKEYCVACAETLADLAAERAQKPKKK